jgi:hypothetical protein
VKWLWSTIHVTTGAKRDEDNIANIGEERDKALRQNSRQPSGLCPESALALSDSSLIRSV